MMMFKGALVAATAALVLGMVSPGSAAGPVKIGMETTLSTPGGYLGEDVRDGFQLAIDQEGGKLGGVPVQLLVEDDGLQPAKARDIVDRFVKAENISIVTGTIFSNVADAIVPQVLAANAFFISPNAGSSTFAGAQCNKNYYVVSWQNDTLHEATGQVATDQGYKKMISIVPNYQAGKDALDGFKRYYKGELQSEIFTRLDQTDFSAEIAQIRAAKPDAIFVFLPGGLGIAFQKQFAQAGLKSQVAVVTSEPGIDTRMIAATGDDLAGVHSSAHWNADFTNPASRKFVADFRAKYNREPTTYASQGYDTARLIGSALKAVGGDVTKVDAFRAALHKADFASVRGSFAFAKNNNPIQDWYSMLAEKDASGKVVNHTGKRIFVHHTDPYATQCPL
jgi:branched-chain amino acid transport system substrate-binding protein